MSAAEVSSFEHRGQHPEVCAVCHPPAPAEAVVITQLADVFQGTGRRYPFRPDYRISWPGCDFERNGRLVRGGAQRSTRGEARSYAKAKARALGLPVVEVGFHMGGGR